MVELTAIQYFLVFLVGCFFGISVALSAFWGYIKDGDIDE